MLVKAVSLFLIFILALAIFGRLRLGKPQPPLKCPQCGRHRIGKAKCSCKADK